MPLTMSDEDVKEKFKPVWALMDTNGDGVLDVEEIMKATKTGEEAAKKMIEMMDTDKDGKVSMDEYLAKMIPTLGSDEELDQVVAGEHMLAICLPCCRPTVASGVAPPRHSMALSAMPHPAPVLRSRSAPPRVPTSTLHPAHTPTPRQAGS